VRKFVFLKDNEALVLKAVRPFVDTRDGKVERFIDDEYLFKGPGTYEPRIEEEIKERIEALIVLPNNALLIRALRDTKDSSGDLRVAGSSVIIISTLMHIFSGCTERLVSLCLTRKSKLWTLERAMSSMTRQPSICEPRKTSPTFTGRSASPESSGWLTSR
jgi:hypothetical protein